MAEHRDPGDGDRGVVRDIRCAGGIVTKRATVGRAKLLDEVAWLSRLPADVRGYFPRVLATRLGPTWAEYDMPYSPWPNLAQLLLDGQLSADDATTAVERILCMAFDRMYRRNTRPTPECFFRRNYLEKVERRMTVAEGASPRLDHLVRAPTLIVNGRTVDSPLRLIRRISTDEQLLGRLAAPRLGMVHGDLKFDNILLAPGPLEASSFLLLDPRGATFAGGAEGDYLDDIAKLRTSTLALYDLVRTGRMVVQVRGTRISTALDQAASPTAGVFAALDTALMGWMPAWAAARNDPQWRLRLSFLTPLLLLANAPFQLAPVTEQTETVALALFTAGAQQLQAATDPWSRGWQRASSN